MIAFRSALCAYSLLFLCTGATAQVPELVTDFNPGTASAFGERVLLARLGTTALLLADDGTTGRELHVLRDGQLELVRDLVPGAAGLPTIPQVFATTETSAYFLLISADGSRTVWETDGTEAGTRLLYDLPIDSALRLANGDIYMLGGGDIYRGRDGVVTTITEDLYSFFGTNRVTLVPFGEGVALLYKNRPRRDAYYLAAITDTVSPLAILDRPFGDNFSDEVTAFGPVPGGLLIGIRTDDDFEGSFIYDTARDTIRRFTDYAITNLIAVSDSLSIGVALNASPDNVREDLYFALGNAQPTMEPFFRGVANEAIMGSRDYEATVANGKMYFAGDDGTGPDAYYVTDGTTAGTRELIRTVNRGDGLSNILNTPFDLYAATGVSSGVDRLSLHRIDPVTNDLTTFFTATTDNNSRNAVTLVNLVDDILYFTWDPEDAQSGKELYRIDVSPVSIPGHTIGDLKILLTPTHFTVDAPHTTPVSWRAFDLSGRLLEAGVTTAGLATPLSEFRGIRIYHFACGNSVGVRKVVGGQ